MSEEFKNRLLTHARTVVDRAGRAQTEEATKQFLIIPFLQLLGYDPLDPDEIVPEADASFSDKFKNRVDYAISKEGVPVIAIEAKKVGSLWISEVLLSRSEGQQRKPLTAATVNSYGVFSIGT